MIARRDLIKIMFHTLALVALFMLASQAMASDASPAGVGLPGESSMTKLVRFVSGPVAYMLSIAGLVAIAGMAAFGSDMSGTMRGVSIFVIVVGFLAFGVQVMTLLFAGAAVPDGGIPAEMIFPLS